MHPYDKTLIGLILLLLIICLLVCVLNVKTDTESIYTPSPNLVEPDMSNSPAEEIVKNAIDNHFTSLESHNNDPQNSHDHQILEGLRKKYKRLLDTEEPFPNIDGINRNEMLKMLENQTLGEIRVKAEKHQHKALILRVLAMVSKANIITSLNSDKPTTELAVLTLVWKRIHHPDNAILDVDKVSFCTKMEDMMMTMLADCVEKKSGLQAADLVINVLIGNANNSGLICINGRVSRMLCVLTNLDRDPILAEPEKDQKEYQNQMMYKAAQIIKDEINSNEEFKRLYCQVEDFLSEDELKQLRKMESELKDKMGNILWDEYVNFLPQDSLLSMIEKARAGVDQ
jgi:hypothetical protein